MYYHDVYKEGDEEEIWKGHVHITQQHIISSHGRNIKQTQQDGDIKYMDR